MPTAAIVGAGVAGLTTAHELAERGYDVTVYERQAILGGKARSVTVPGSGTDGRGDLPGEHGFRFFPRFYRHVVDTMSRIPYRGNRDGVAGNLVGASEGLFAQQGAPGLIVGTGLPTTEAELRVFLQTWLDNVWALSREEYEFFAARLWQIMSSCADRRIGEYERLVWTDFIGVDRFSDRYRELFGSAMTHTLLAASGAAASARTVGRHDRPADARRDGDRLQRPAAQRSDERRVDHTVGRAPRLARCDDHHRRRDHRHRL